MQIQLKHFPKRKWSLPLLIFGIGLLTIFSYRPTAQPLFGDRAYLVYMAQGIQRGEPIYETTTFGYAPLGSMISALAMFIGDGLGMPNYLAPRLFAVPLFALAGMLLYWITYHLTRNQWLAIWAALFNFGFKNLNTIMASNLEPKALVQILLLLMILALQKRRWFWAGLAVSLAGMCWQPSAMMALVPLMMGAYHFRQGDRSPLLKIIVGGLLGFVPVIIYLVLTQQLTDFYLQGIYIKFIGTSDFANRQNRFWVNSVIIDNLIGLQAILLPLSLVGIGWHIYAQFRKSVGDVLPLNWFDDRWGGLALVTTIWIIYSNLASAGDLEAQGGADFLYAGFLVAFWGAVGLWTGYRLILAALVNLSWPKHRLKLVLPLISVVLVLNLLITGLTTELIKTIHTEEEKIANYEHQAEDQTLLVINYHEYYVITNQRTQWPMLFYTPLYETYLVERLEEGCATLIKDLQTHHYNLIYIRYRPNVNFGACFATIYETIQTDPVLQNQYQYVRR